MKSDKIAIIIPARFGSTRLPGKPLIKINEKPIIQWVYERACKSKLAERIIVATDNDEIYSAVKAFGGEAIMTAATHQNGSDRIAEVAKKNPDFAIIVNVQGDEPLIDPESIDKAIRSLLEDKTADITTLVRKIDEPEDITNPNVVKAVFDNSGYAMYFSRSPIPYERQKGHADYFAHIGLYGYKRESLFNMTEMEQTNLEKAECLEQLRALQNGMKIKTVIVDYKPIGIDTEDDLEKFRRYLEAI